MATGSSQNSEQASGGSLGTRLDRVCDAFEAQWRQALRQEGPTPRIEDYISNVNAEERWAFLRELLLTDEQYHELAGELFDTREYQQRFPQFGDLIPSLFRKPASLDRIRDYRLLEVIGRGGMGVVYKAQHLRLGKIRAVKVLARHLLDNPEAVERFRLEVQNCGRLDHPNIVQALDAGEDNELHFLVMEFVSGWNLARVVEAYVQAGRRVPVGAACEMIRQASVGLQHAHEHLLVHRDIKPSNLMLTGSGVVKILDLGLARFIAEHQPASRLTISAGPMGTWDYMAPEQWTDASSVDIRADIYSLGCTLYYLLAGKAPFSDELHRGLLPKQLAHQHDPLPSVLEEREDAPEELQAIIDRMTAKSPEQRYAEPAEAAEDLARFADREAVATLLGTLQLPPGSPAGDSAPNGSSVRTDSAGSPRAASSSRRGRTRPWYQRLRLWLGGSRTAAGRPRPAAQLQRLGAWLVIGLALFGAAGVARWWISRAADERPVADPRLDPVRNIVLLPGLHGQWWFDEVPWYTPAVRSALAAAIRSRDLRSVLGDEPNEYRDPDVTAVQKWLLEAAESCHELLSERQRRQFEQLQDLAGEELENDELEQSLQACYDEFVADQTDATPESAEDLHVRALLEHRLAGLRHDTALAKQALLSYNLALEQYERAAGQESPLAQLCRADSARLCYEVLNDYQQAFTRFETVVAQENPLLFQIETLTAYGQAGRIAGDYDKDENLKLAKRLLEGTRERDLSRNHPLWAHVYEQHAWSLLDQWSVRQAYEELDWACSIRHLNCKSDPLAALHVFRDLHGKAMAQRYLGKVDMASEELDDLLAKIDVELKQAEEQVDRPGWPRYVRDLRGQRSKALERRADCELFEGAASDSTMVDLSLASDMYGQASELAPDFGTRVAQACKRCLALALSGEVLAARAEYSKEDVSRRSVIGPGQERARMLRQLVEAVLTLKEKDTAGRRAPLRQFLVQFDLAPYEADRYRREILELQLFCAELLLASEQKSTDAQIARQDAVYLEQLLRQLEDRELMAFLRRYYDVAIATVGDSDPNRVARLMLASRGPDPDRDSEAVSLVFHLRLKEGLVAVVAPDEDPVVFRLSWGREQVTEPKVAHVETPVRLPEPLLRLIHEHQAASHKIECLWSDVKCWPESQRQFAVTPQEFPFADLQDTLSVR